MEKARNLKFILRIFEQLSGLKINFHKNEVYCLGDAADRSDVYSNIFTCNVADLPMKYLGMPIDEKRLAVSQWGPIDEKFIKKLAGWKGKLLSAGDRLTLVNACLSSLPLFMLSFLEAPKGVLKKWDIHRKRMIWNENENKKKYHLVKWETVCLPKESGGLGVLDLGTMNKSLLCKWLWKLDNTEGTWQELLRSKYLHNQVLSQAQSDPSSSHFWQCLMGVNHTFQQYSSKVMNNGERTLFWEDKCINNTPLAVQFPRLYSITFSKHITVAKVKEEGWGCIRFRRTLWGETATQFASIQTLVDAVHLNDEPDRVQWNIGSTGRFQVKGLYLSLRAAGIFPHKFLWKIKIPLKVKIFIWLALKNRILTKDNLAKRGWTGNEQCHFCSQQETVEHLLFRCCLSKMVWQVVMLALELVRPPDGMEDLVGAWADSFPPIHRKLALSGGAAVCWTIWKTRNDACFNKKNPDDPAALVYRLCNILNLWALLQKRQDISVLEEGVEKMKKVIREALARRHGWAPTILRLTG